MEAILQAIKKFRVDKNVLISYNELTKIPLHTPIEIDLNDLGSIITTKINEDEEGISFRVEMQAGKQWTYHYHNCNETLLIYKGKLFDHISKKSITKMQPMLIKAYTNHHIEAIENSIFYVEFKNPL